MLFDFDVSEYCVDKLLSKLQEIVDKIVTGVDVRCYPRASCLMQRIMFEYGCFENVLESSGERNRIVRNSIVYPKIRTYNNKPLYLEGKYYYIDMNGAYAAHKMEFHII